jgi:Tol biopolymer transport system component
MNDRTASARGVTLITVSLILLAGCAPSGQASAPASVSVAESSTASASPSGPTLARLEGQLVFDHVDANELVSLWTDRGTGPQALFPEDPNEQEKASWSPDGAVLTFDRLLPSGARIIQSDLGAPPAEIATGCAAPECLEDGFSAVSPDGTKLAFRRLFGSTEPTASSIVIADASGENARIMPELPWSEGEYKSPRWSPDGASIVFALEGHDAGGAVSGSTLYTLTVATAEVRQLTPDGLSAASPDWSQSDLIVFGTDPDQPDAIAKNIYVIAPDGTGMRNVTAGSVVDGSATTPRWIPGTDRIVFANITSGTIFHTSGTLSDIWVINADGTQAQQVTATGGQDAYPAVSPG